MSTDLTILAVTDRYTVGEVERAVFATALKPQPYKLVCVPFSATQALSELPDSLAKQVDGIFILRHHVTKADLARFPRLRCIVRTGVGYDRIDRVAAAEAGVALHNVPDYGTAEVADHAVTLALSLRRGVILQHDLQRGPDPSWKPRDVWVDAGTPGLVRRFRALTYAIVGLGRIGTAVALRAKAFGFKVIFYDPLVTNGVEVSLGVDRVRTLGDALRQGDVVSLHCTDNATTRHIIDATALQLFKRDAILVNVSRGALVDLDAVYDALRSDRLAAAGIDVVEVEPPVCPLPRLIKAYREREEWLTGRLVITPHVAFYSPEAVRDMQVKSAEVMRDVLFDGLQTNVVEPTRSY